MYAIKRIVALNIVARYKMYATITRLMAKQCDITGKKTQIGGKYSNRTRATQFNPSGKTKRAPNLQKKRIYVPEIDKTVSIKVSAKALRTIAKNGAYKTLKEAKLI